jgi:hypothetical protein
MNLREENAAAGLRALLEIYGEPVKLPGYDRPVCGLINRGGQEAAFMPGLQLLENSGWSIRFLACDISKEKPIQIQTFLTIDGRKWRVTKVTSYPGTVLVELSDPKN